MKRHPILTAMILVAPLLAVNAGVPKHCKDFKGQDMRTRCCHQAFKDLQHPHPSLISHENLTWCVKQYQLGIHYLDAHMVPHQPEPVYHDHHHDLLVGPGVN